MAILQQQNVVNGSLATFFDRVERFLASMVAYINKIETSF